MALDRWRPPPSILRREVAMKSRTSYLVWGLVAATFAIAVPLAGPRLIEFWKAEIAPTASKRTGGRFADQGRGYLTLSDKFIELNKIHTAEATRPTEPRTLVLR